MRKCGDRVTAPVIMWVKAFDMIMDKLRVAGLDFQNVVAVSGAGQVCILTFKVCGLKTAK